MDSKCPDWISSSVAQTKELAAYIVAVEKVRVSEIARDDIKVDNLPGRRQQPR
jgi:hypothetical protein